MSNTEALRLARDALARIDVATVGAEATNSRDLDDWRDDINGIQRIARAAIAAIDALAQQPAASGGPAGVPFKPETWPVDADGDAPNLCTVCGTPLRYGSRHSRCAAPQPAPARVPLTDEAILRIVRQTIRGTTLRLTRDVGPYEVTEPTHDLVMLVRAIEAAIAATPAQGEQK